MFIREQGEVRPWGKHMHTYFDYDGWTYWTMGAPLDETILINRERTKSRRVATRGLGARQPLDPAFADAEGSSANGSGSLRWLSELVKTKNILASAVAD